MNDSSKKALLIFAGGGLLFMLLKYVFKIKDEKEKEKIEEKKEEEPKTEKDSRERQREKQKDAMIIKKAFTDAVRDKQPSKFLNEMNAEFAKTYKMKVHKSKSTGKLFVADLEGKVILD